jgi:hypothetical protein
MTSNFIATQKLRRKEVDPKVFAISIEGERGEGISLVVAYCLEEAMEMAKEEAEKNVGGSINNYHVKNWSHMTIASLKSRIYDLDFSAPGKTRKTKVPVNEVMKKIIENGDIKLFEKIKGKLKKSEVRYIEQQLSFKNLLNM